MLDICTKTIDIRRKNVFYRLPELVDNSFLLSINSVNSTASSFAFSALTLLVGRQEGHPACKKQSGGVLAWLSVWSEVQTCIWLS